MTTNRFNIFSIGIIIILLFIFLLSCDKGETNISDIETYDISEITNISAKSGGVVKESDLQIIEKGIVWCISSAPTVNLHEGISYAKSDIESFVLELTELLPNTEYFVRVFATTDEGVFYGDEKSFKTLSLPIPTACPDYPSVTDIDGNIYKTVLINEVCWMAENLATTKFNNGDEIPNITDNQEWAAINNPAYCWYNNDYSNYGIKYDALYNYYVIESGNICPQGWRVPTETEWNDLIQYCGGDIIAGAKLKEKSTSHWISPNTDANNESGFTGLPGGKRGFSDGSFADIKKMGVWWSSMDNIGSRAWAHALLYNESRINIGYLNKNYGFSIRCIKE